MVIAVPVSSPSPRVHSSVETPVPVLFLTTTPSLPRFLKMRNFQSRRFASTWASLRMLATTAVGSLMAWPDSRVSSSSFFLRSNLLGEQLRAVGQFDHAVRGAGRRLAGVAVVDLEDFLDGPRDFLAAGLVDDGLVGDADDRRP